MLGFVLQVIMGSIQLFDLQTLLGQVQLLEQFHTWVFLGEGLVLCCGLILDLGEGQ